LGYPSPQPLGAYGSASVPEKRKIHNRRFRRVDFPEKKMLFETVQEESPINSKSKDAVEDVVS
jgi:hypothetical protein